MKTILGAIALSTALATTAFAQDAGTEEATSLTEAQISEIMAQEPSLDVAALTDEQVLIIKQAMAEGDQELHEKLGQIVAEQ